MSRNEKPWDSQVFTMWQDNTMRLGKSCSESFLPPTETMQTNSNISSDYPTYCQEKFSFCEHVQICTSVENVRTLMGHRAVIAEHPLGASYRGS
jgi:hypothetical protein